MNIGNSTVVLTTTTEESKEMIIDETEWNDRGLSPTSTTTTIEANNNSNDKESTSSAAHSELPFELSPTIPVANNDDLPQVQPSLDHSPTTTAAIIAGNNNIISAEAAAIVNKNSSSSAMVVLEEDSKEGGMEPVASSSKTDSMRFDELVATAEEELEVDISDNNDDNDSGVHVTAFGDASDADTDQAVADYDDEPAREQPSDEEPAPTEALTTTCSLPTADKTNAIALDASLSDEIGSEPANEDNTKKETIIDTVVDITTTTPTIDDAFTEPSAEESSIQQQQKSNNNNESSKSIDAPSAADHDAPADEVDRPINNNEDHAAPQEEEKKESSPVETAQDNNAATVSQQDGEETLSADDEKVAKVEEIVSTKVEEVTATTSNGADTDSDDITETPVAAAAAEMPDESMHLPESLPPSNSTTCTNAETKRPSMDASGMCSMDLPSKQRQLQQQESDDSHDPPSATAVTNQNQPTSLSDIKENSASEEEMSSQVLNFDLSSRDQTTTTLTAHDEEEDETQAAAMSLEPIQTRNRPVMEVSLNSLPTPVTSTVKRYSEKAQQLANDVAASAETSPSKQLPSELLANKEKEGFGLLARAESFRKQEAPVQQQTALSPTPPQMQQREIDYQEIEYSNSFHRIPQEPDASHRRGESAVASMSRRNSGRGDSFMENNNVQNQNIMLDDNSNRPLDDNSWRPSHASYPHSPQGLPGGPPQQAIMTASGHYLMVPQPQHQGQPPHAFIPPPPAMIHHQASFHSHQTQLLGQPGHQAQLLGQPGPYGYASVPAMQHQQHQPMPSPGAPSDGKRKIRLKLQEEILARPSGHNKRPSFFFGRGSTRKLLTAQPLHEDRPQTNEVDRGVITVSWYEGTSTLELEGHVKASVLRKLKLEDGQKLDDTRIIDTKSDPPEEVVLSPYIPNGSEFVLRYKIKLVSGRSSPVFYGPPDSPSAAPSPFPSHGNLGSLDQSQLAVLRKQLDAVQEGESSRKGKSYRSRWGRSKGRDSPSKPNREEVRKHSTSPKDDKLSQDSENSDGDNESDTNTLQPESSVDAKLREITELLMGDKQKQQRYGPPVEKRRVIFALANYFVLLLATITIAAELQARAPAFLSWVEGQLENVHNCSADQEALYKCISNGEFAGLFATVILWLSRSASTKQVFLLGFDSPQKLWIVFYESLVGAFCWGVSYMFIRRGMNPDTRPQFLQRYWKDCMYGSLAGFNATFLKQVLKNLIPREAVEEAFSDRQLKILGWLPSFH